MQANSCNFSSLVAQTYVISLTLKGWAEFFSENPWQFHMINVKGKEASSHGMGTASF
jgi:hypothetical protein